MLDRFGSGLKDAVKKLAGKSVIDKAAVDELVRDLQRVLIQSDVNVKLVMELTTTIKKRSLEEEPPKGMGAREHVLRIVYEELVNLMGEEVDVKLESQTILMAGLQGSGKTTTTGKLARFFQRKGLRVGSSVLMYSGPVHTINSAHSARRSMCPAMESQVRQMLLASSPVE